MNQVSLIGRLTQDPVLREGNGGKKHFVAFTVAVNEYRGNSEYTNFVPCIAWDNIAENMNKYLKKGSLVGVTGRISVRLKNDNGRYETIININTDRVEFLESKNSNASHNNYEPISQPTTNNFEGFKPEKTEVEPEQNNDVDDLDDSILWD